MLDAAQQYAGTPNAEALPAFFSLDTRLGKAITFRKHKFCLSFSMFNGTNHANFDAVRRNAAPAASTWISIGSFENSVRATIAGGLHLNWIVLSPATPSPIR